MTKEKKAILPVLQRTLTEAGQNIRLARLRRRFSASIVARRAGISRNTLRAIENGEPSVSFGAYANVIFSLGLEKDIAALARDDVLGRKLQDIGLTVKKRAPKIKKEQINKTKNESLPK